MKTTALIVYAMGAGLAAALTILVLCGALLGFWLPDWPQSRVEAVGVTATLVGIIAANAFLRRLTRAERAVSSVATSPAAADIRRRRSFKS
jgi:hypothetical protein